VAEDPGLTTPEFVVGPQDLTTATWIGEEKNGKAYNGVIVNSINCDFWTECHQRMSKNNVEKFIVFNLLKLELRYCNLFRNGSATK